MNVRIIDTSSANTRSVQTALARVDLRPEPARDARDVREADYVVLPGVGSFGTAAGRIDEQGFGPALRERIEADRPTLAICVGLQLLARASEEAPGVQGLAVIDATVRRFGAGVRVPHMGWNRVREREGDGWASFANSYRIGAEALPGLEAEGWDVGTCEHGEPFVALLRRGRVLACQFHPELSGLFGHRLLREWASGEQREEAPC